ncbi:MAG TPA: ATP-grasp domain-containing protein [Niastella sp.]
MNTAPVLLIPEKTDVEFEQVVAAYTKRGGRVKRLGKYWVRDEQLATEQLAIYGNQAFALVLAQIYELELLSPDDTLITRLEHRWTKRTVILKRIGDIQENDFPVFIKPVIPKMFLAGVFQHITDFKKATEGLPDTEEILVSTIIDNIQAEARCYLMNGEVQDLAFYEGNADLLAAKAFVTAFAAANKEKLPAVVVADIAYAPQTGWFILEFNACWGAGLNSCNAENVIDCILSATFNVSR